MTADIASGYPVLPLTGIGAHDFGTGVVMRLDFLPSAHSAMDLKQFRLYSMTPSQALELAQRLTSAAEKARAGQTSPSQSS